MAEQTLNFSHTQHFVSSPYYSNISIFQVTSYITAAATTTTQTSCYTLAMFYVCFFDAPLLECTTP